MRSTGLWNTISSVRRSRLDSPGRPALFATTEEFLRRFGVGSTEQLPEMNVEQREEIRSEVEEELNLRIDEEGHLLDDDEDPEEDADENENEKEIENNEAYGEDSISMKCSEIKVVKKRRDERGV